MADRRRSSLKIPEPPTLHACLHGNVTIPAQVIELLRRAGGATIVDLTQATGWLPHTTRAALTGLRKRGYTVIREGIGAEDSAYRISDAPSYRGNRSVLQRDAMDGRGPKQKATQAA
jgi:Protein of unknown function (DUF3489)